MKEDIEKSLDVLYAGGIFLYPTDTVWGLGCDATNEVAVKKIYAAKQRNEQVPLLVLVNSIAMLERYVEEVPQVAYDIIELSEKPITIVFEKGKNLAKNCLNSDGSIGIRVTNEQFTNQLITRFKRPIISTSANIHGQPTPSIFNEISIEIKSAVDYIVKYRQNDVSPTQASSIIKIKNNSEITIIRK
ncbi:MAG TPA: L-threonylcarbamoyladenylate synthase [Bacteroidales bacterium]|nr:L-threonylcarbamoyladenylate synthase [Bacteroidales bacterium]HRS17893.1 L-threonylcarbamoyladenylate synthase [Bacteroidales bacterium]